MKNRRGLTVIELLVIICIIGVFLAILFSGCSMYPWNTEKTYVGVPVRVYEKHKVGEDDEFRVDVRLNNGQVETFKNVDEPSWWYRKFNSATIQGQLANAIDEDREKPKQTRQKYRFKVFGPGRSEYWSRFDNVIEATPE